MVFKVSNNLQFPMEVLEAACDKIMDEIIDFLIEGICFEIHRAVILEYYPLKEHAIKNQKFELFTGVEDPGERRDIFFNDRSKQVPMSTCQFCGQKKAAQTLVRHMNLCRARNADEPIWCARSPFQTEIPQVTGTEKGIQNLSIQSVLDNFFTANFGSKAVDRAPTYEEMSPDEAQEFLMKYCGAVSKKTGKPCRNSLKCNIHSKEVRAEIRTFVYESIAVRMADTYGEFP